MRHSISGQFVFCVLLFLSVAGCAQSARTKTQPSGLEQQSIIVDGLQRSYYVHFPSAHQSTAKLPLLLVLHGGGRGDGLPSRQ